MAIGDSNVSHARRVLGWVDHITVFENNFNPAGTTPCAASHFSSRLFPPAPLTGDVGRGCGDASRALLFSAEDRAFSNSVPNIVPTNVPHPRGSRFRLCIVRGPAILHASPSRRQKLNRSAHNCHHATVAQSVANDAVFKKSFIREGAQSLALMHAGPPKVSGVGGKTSDAGDLRRPRQGR